MEDLRYIPTSELRRCPYSLRPVRKDSIEYLQHREAIQRGGIDLPLLVRQGFEVVDGQTRHEIALELKMAQVPCLVRSITDFEVLVKQVQVNTNASNGEYAARLWRIMQMEPEQTIDQLAHLVTRTREWIFEKLRLMGLVNKEVLFNGTLPVLVAAELAKLPKEYQIELNSLIGVLTTKDLVTTIWGTVQRYREQLKDKRFARNLQIQSDLSPRFRNFREVLSELNEPSAAISTLHRLNAKSALDGWLAAISWMLRVDPVSRKQRQQQFDRLARKAELERQRSKRT